MLKVIYNVIPKYNFNSNQYKYICNNELLNYKVIIFVLVRIEIKFWYKIITNF